MTATTDIPTRLVDFDRVECYHPVIGGVRHLTRTDSRQKPPNGTIVELVDGNTYIVGSRRKSPHIYDCNACAEVYLDEHGAPQGKPTSQAPRPRVPAPRRQRRYIDHPAGAVARPASAEVPTL